MSNYALFTPIARRDLETSISGSKSLTNRALILASIYRGDMYTLEHPSMSQDSRVLRSALSTIGIDIEDVADGWAIKNSVLDVTPVSAEIDFGPAGTSSRYFLALASFMPGFELTLTGSERLQNRPMHPLIEALRSLGAQIDCLEKEGFLPVKVHGIKPAATHQKVTIEGNISSQFSTAIALIQGLFPGGLEVEISGLRVSQSYAKMTDEVIEYFKNDNSGRFRIEGDAGSAGYLWAAAALGAGKVSIDNIPANSHQGELKILSGLRAMGAHFEAHENVFSVVPAEHLHGATIDCSDFPDSAQTLAVVAAFADGETVLTGLSTLKHKETDRLTALAKELSKMGVTVHTTINSLTISSRANRGAQIETYEDHRMAMAFGLAAFRLQGMIIENVEVVEKSYPEYWNHIAQLGVQIEPQ